MNALFLLALCILSSASASFFLKLGTNSLSEPLNLISVISNSMLWLGGLCYGAALIGYVYLLRLLPLSLAQPAITAGVSIVTALAAVLFLREQMASVNWAGLLMVCFGIFLLFFGRS